MAVLNSSSVMSAFPSVALMALFADLIIDSCAPPKRGASVGFKWYTTPLFEIDSLIFSLSYCRSNVFSSLSAALISVSLSE